MRFRNEVVFIALLSTLLLSQEGMIDYFKEVAGNRNFYIRGAIIIHVRDESGNLVKSEITGEIAVRNLADFYLKVDKPEILSGLKFILLMKSKRLYSGFDGEMDMDRVDVDENFIEKIVLRLMDIITSPVFSYSIKMENGGERYRFFPAMKSFLHGVGMDPIVIESFFVGSSPKEMKITGENPDEYILLRIDEFVIGADVDAYFNVGK